MSLTRFLRESAAAETERVASRVRSAVAAFMLMGLAALVLLVGVIFALVGAYESLSQTLPGWQAGGIIGLGALGFCFFLLLLAKSRGRARPRPGSSRPASATQVKRDELEATAELGAAASSAARDFVRDHRPTGLELTMAAFIVGLVASRRGSRTTRKTRED